jgi:uncharacterized protein (DUF1778 family)
MSIHCIDNYRRITDTAQMAQSTKGAQLQIRVSRAEKAAIQRAARNAGMDMSAYVLSRVLMASSAHFEGRVAACARQATTSYALAELNSFLASLTAQEFREAVAHSPQVALTPFIANYVAAMVEYGCARLNIPTPPWTREVAALPEPAFGTTLQSLRLYLLTHSPAAFRCRNIFIDATLGARI